MLRPFSRQNPLHRDLLVGLLAPGLATAFLFLVGLIDIGLRLLDREDAFIRGIDLSNPEVVLSILVGFSVRLVVWMGTGAVVAFLVFNLSKQARNWHPLRPFPLRHGLIGALGTGAGPIVMGSAKGLIYGNFEYFLPASVTFIIAGAGSIAGLLIGWLISRWGIVMQRDASP